MAASASLQLQYALNRNICQIHSMHKIGWPQLILRKKEVLYNGKNCLNIKRLNALNYREKMFLGTTISDYSSFS